MDPLMLRAVVSELAAVLPGQPLGELLQLDSHRFLLRFDDPPFPRLHAAIHPRLSTLHLARRVKAPSTSTELARALTEALAGRRATAARLHPAGRIVLLDFEGGFRLVFELMGRASNLLLLDGDGKIVRFARPHQGEFRRPAEGIPWEPPPEPPTPRGASPLLEREVEFRAAAGERPAEVRRELTERLAAGPLSPTLHAPAPPGELSEAVALDGGNLFAFPLPLRCGHALAAIPFGTASEAEEAATTCVVKHLAFEALKSALAGQVRREARRSGDLEKVLAAELEQAHSTAATSRREGEILLAGLRLARRDGSTVRVPDCYDPEGSEVEIAIDPRLDLQANAARRFRQAKRSTRSLELIPPRLAALATRRAALQRAGEEIEAAGSRAELEALEGRFQTERLVRAFRRPARADVAQRAEYVPVREFRSPEGFTMVVGRSSADNDHITFKVAAPHDLWLHAAGWPGAHVIVRNPRRLGELPEGTLRAAASLAAWFSKGRDEKELDVHYTFRRHVRKGKGMSPGMVMLRRHRTIRVAPGLPKGANLLD